MWSGFFHRRAVWAALALAVVVALSVGGVVVERSRSHAPVVAAVGPATWPFQGSAAVADARLAAATAALKAGAVPYEQQARDQGGKLTVGPSHALFATHYEAGALDIVVTIAPVEGVRNVVALAGIYATDAAGHVTRSVALVGASDASVSGNVESYLSRDSHPVTVVVGGPRAGGLLVNVDGYNVGPSELSGAQTVSDPRGISWIYRAEPGSTAHPDNGVLSVTDGNGDIEHLLYHGRPAAETITVAASS